MKRLHFKFLEEENGWATPRTLLSGNIYLIVELKKEGMMVIKKSNTLHGPKPKVFISRKGGTRFEIRLYGKTADKYIQVVTSTEPIEIKYANI